MQRPPCLVFKTFIPHLADPARSWLTLAMASTLAGNLTLLGSVANLTSPSARGQAEITFWEYARRRPAYHPHATPVSGC